eukprot:scaffold607737_cov20-Prasinocladus_malaysianus.AAC.2
MMETSSQQDNMSQQDNVQGSCNKMQTTFTPHRGPDMYGMKKGIQDCAQKRRIMHRRTVRTPLQVNLEVLSTDRHVLLRNMHSKQHT